jgi:hypothetical protein
MARRPTLLIDGVSPLKSPLASHRDLDVIRCPPYFFLSQSADRCEQFERQEGIITL